MILNDKNYYHIATNIFLKYINKNFESKFFWKSIKINFKNCIKKECNIFNDKIWGKIRRFLKTAILIVANLKY